MDTPGEILRDSDVVMLRAACPVAIRISPDMRFIIDSRALKPSLAQSPTALAGIS
jgi:hypothetical protein